MSNVCWIGIKFIVSKGIHHDTIEHGVYVESLLFITLDAVF